MRSLQPVFVLLAATVFSACAANSAREAVTHIPDAVPMSAADFADPGDTFSFIVFGDRTGGRRPGVFSRAVRIANQMGPAFVVSVGDYIEGYTDDLEKLDQEWANFEEVVDQLEGPFFYTAGNHDYSNLTMARLWKERRGDPYYSFVYKDVLFISLNTEDPPVPLSRDILARTKRFEEAMRADPAGTQQRVLDAVRNRPVTPKLPGSVAISDEQVGWVSETLANNQDVRWTIILMHKPAWLYGSEPFEEIEKLLSDRPYTVIAGHEHYFTSEVRNGAQYIDMGTTGGVWLKDGPGRIDHFLWVQMSPNGPKATSLDLDTAEALTAAR